MSPYRPQRRRRGSGVQLAGPAVDDYASRIAELLERCGVVLMKPVLGKPVEVLEADDGSLSFELLGVLPDGREQALSSLDFPRPLVDRYLNTTRNAIFYLDPHICTRCRNRSTELLWQCPHCHDWNTFVEERIAPAKDSEATLSS